MRVVRKALKAVKDRRGVAAVIFALTAAAVVGAGGLATEASYWYYTKRRAQTAADGAAMGAGIQLLRYSHDSAIAEGFSDAARNGFPNGGDTIVSVNIPPTSGAYSGRGGTAEVIIRQRQPRLFSGLFLAENATVAARAVAATLAAGQACALALDRTRSGSLAFSGTSTTTAPGCLLATNSANDHAFDVAGGADVTAKALYSMGGIDFTGQAITVNTELNPISYGPRPIPDPYGYLPDPTNDIPLNCTTTGNQLITGGGTVNFAAGSRFCGGIRIGQSLAQTGVVDLAPGTYYVTDGNLAVNAGSTLTCSTCSGASGVTIIFTGDDPSAIGRPVLNGTATITLQSPATGTYAGVLFYQDRDAVFNPNQPAIINGTLNSRLEGAFYFPNGALRINGDATQTSDCMQLVARTIEINGNARLSLGLCEERGAITADVLVVRLVE